MGFFGYSDLPVLADCFLVGYASIPKNFNSREIFTNDIHVYYYN